MRLLFDPCFVVVELILSKFLRDGFLDGDGFWDGNGFPVEIKSSLFAFDSRIEGGLIDMVITLVIVSEMVSGMEMGPWLAILFSRTYWRAHQRRCKTNLGWSDGDGYLNGDGFVDGFWV